MASVYDKFLTSPELETQGIIADLGEYGRYRVARMGGANSRYSRVLSEKLRPFRRQMALNALPDAKRDELLMEAFVEGALLGWEDVEGHDGPIAFSVEAAKKLFKDLPELMLTIQGVAADAENYRASLVKDDVKN